MIRTTSSTCRSTLPVKLKPRSDDVYILAVARKGMMDEAKDQVTDLLRVRRQVPFGQAGQFWDSDSRHYFSATFARSLGGCSDRNGGGLIRWALWLAALGS